MGKLVKHKVSNTEENRKNLKSPVLREIRKIQSPQYMTTWENSQFQSPLQGEIRENSKSLVTWKNSLKKSSVQGVNRKNSKSPLLVLRKMPVKRNVAKPSILLEILLTSNMV